MNNKNNKSYMVIGKTEIALGGGFQYLSLAISFFILFLQEKALFSNQKKFSQIII